MKLFDAPEWKPLGKKIDGLVKKLQRGEMSMADACLEISLWRDSKKIPRGDESPDNLWSSERRRLILDFNLSYRQGWARYCRHADPDFLDCMPAQEIIAAHDAGDPEELQRRWLAAGGQVTQGKMAALKTDPIWEKISLTGDPWGPFFEHVHAFYERDLTWDETKDLGFPEVDLSKARSFKRPLSPGLFFFDRLPVNYRLGQLGTVPS